MTTKGIIFSAPMVRALLDGRKTQTRRLIKPTKKDFGPGQLLITEGPRFGGTGYRFIEPYASGDRLYVREHWKSTPAYDDLAPSEMGGDEPLRYLADDATFNWADADGAHAGKHRQGMHMPRWASRLWLEVTDVRVQRLQSISRNDCYEEGIERPVMPNYGSDVCATDNARNGYRKLWNSLHTEPGTTWEANPWIVAVSFNVNHGSIDA